MGEVFLDGVDVFGSGVVGGGFGFENMVFFG